MQAIPTNCSLKVRRLSITAKARRTQHIIKLLAHKPSPSQAAVTHRLLFNWKEGDRELQQQLPQSPSTFENQSHTQMQQERSVTGGGCVIKARRRAGDSHRRVPSQRREEDSVGSKFRNSFMFEERGEGRGGDRNEMVAADFPCFTQLLQPPLL